MNVVEKYFCEAFDYVFNEKHSFEKILSWGTFIETSIILWE